MTQSSSYQEFRKRTQEIFNFAVLVTSSVPVLKQNINLFEKGIIKRIPDPDFFEPSVVYEIKQVTIDTLSTLLEKEKIEKLILLQDIPLNNAIFKKKVIEAIGEQSYKSHRHHLKKQSIKYIENLRDCTNKYQTTLASYLYISIFSFFEAFITDLASEINSRFTKVDTTKHLEEFELNKENIKDLYELSKEFDPRKLDRYTKFSTKIDAKGYKSAEELLFSTFGQLFKDRVENLKANEIPHFLEKTLLFKMSSEDTITFNNIRSNRNSIAHGTKNFSPNLSNVVNANKFLKSLSEKIDKHIVFYFFNPKNYRK